MGWCGVEWIDLWLRIETSGGLYLRVPQNVGKFLSSSTIGGFSRRTQLHEVSWIYVIYSHT
jgi:hypothetical protein